MRLKKYKYPCSDKVMKLSLSPKALGRKEKLYYLDPQDFIDRLPVRMAKTEHDRDKVKKLAERIKKGLDIDPLFLWVPYNEDEDGKEYPSHRIPVALDAEGRHRAMASRSLHLEEIPVIVVMHDKHHSGSRNANWQMEEGTYPTPGNQ